MTNYERIKNMNIEEMAQYIQYERIKNMNIEEMAQYIQNEDICLVPECNVSYTTPANCYACTKKWLESESDEEC